MLPHPGRYIELVMLVVAFSACLLMWIVARRVRGYDELSQPLNGGTATATHEASYKRLRNLYLCVYTLATFGDWIQGGFLYALYAEYGYSQRDIGLIFVAGYASAMTLGTYVAALGDSGGHRRNCIAYGLLYAVSCLLCNSGSLPVLLLGRVLGGVAYSILYTSFESWLIAEAESRRLPRPLLSRLFSVATFFNAGSAVIAGMVGHMAVEVIPHTSHNKFASAFDVAVVALLAASLVAATRWGERFGDQMNTASESLLRSCRTIHASRPLVALGLVNSFYEAALYVFVFLWTPALERRSRLGDGGQMGHGLVFSVFMLSKMAGSQAFHALSAHLSPSGCLQLVFGGSALALALPLFSDSYERTLLAFCLFEALLGIYWPAIALIRCGSISDAQRSSTMAVFRVLLNLLVITVLPLAGGLPETLAFGLACGMLLLCLGFIAVVKEAETAKEAACATAHLNGSDPSYTEAGSSSDSDPNDKSPTDPMLDSDGGSTSCGDSSCGELYVGELLPVAELQQLSPGSAHDAPLRSLPPPGKTVQLETLSTRPPTTSYAASGGGCGNRRAGAPGGSATCSGGSLTPAMEPASRRLADLEDDNLEVVKQGAPASSWARWAYDSLGLAGDGSTAAAGYRPVRPRPG